MCSLYGFSEIPLRGDSFVPSAADTRLFFADLDQVGVDPESDWLGSDEKERMEKLRDPLIRRRFLARRVLLRGVISAACGMPACEVRYRYSRFGKPMVGNLADGQTFHFNTSASEGCCAIATSRRGPVGVDIERRGRRIDHAQVLRLAASAEELGWHSSAKTDSSDLMAIKIWVIKEAILKAAGRGLQVNPRTISLPRDLVVSEVPRAWTGVHVPGLEETFRVQLIVNEGSVLALARSGTKGWQQVEAES